MYVVFIAFLVSVSHAHLLSRLNSNLYSICVRAATNDDDDSDFQFSMSSMDEGTERVMAQVLWTMLPQPSVAFDLRLSFYIIDKRASLSGCRSFGSIKYISGCSTPSVYVCTNASYLFGLLS